MDFLGPRHCKDMGGAFRHLVLRLVTGPDLLFVDNVGVLYLSMRD